MKYEGLGKCYQPRLRLGTSSARHVFGSVIPDITKSSSNNGLLYCFIQRQTILLVKKRVLLIDGLPILPIQVSC
jgi:hypothetical protein